jgi:hypothetical protein
MDDTFPDLGSLTDLQLKDAGEQLAEGETEISFNRRIVRPAPAGRVRDPPARVARTDADRPLGSWPHPPLVGRSPMP